MEKPNVTDLYKNQRDNAKRHKMLYHYTTFEVLLKIITSKKLMLSKLSLLNDPLEYERLSGDPFIQNRIYVSCFNNYEKDKIPLWKMYADGSYGIRIGFPVKSISAFEDTSSYQFELLRQSNEELNVTYPWHFHSASLLDVIYDNDFTSYYEVKDVFDDDKMPKDVRPTAVGFLKKKCRDFEQETRIRVALSINDAKGTKLDRNTNKFVYTSPPYSHVFCSIPDNLLLEMKIMFSPNSSDLLVTMMKNEIHRIISKFPDDNFQRSDIRINGR